MGEGAAAAVAMCVCVGGGGGWHVGFVGCVREGGLRVLC